MKKRRIQGEKGRKTPILAPEPGKLRNLKEKAPNGARGSGRVRPHPPRGFGNFGGIWGVLGFCRFRRRRRRPSPFPPFSIKPPRNGENPPNSSSALRLRRSRRRRSVSVQNLLFFIPKGVAREGLVITKKKKKKGEK